MIHFIERRILAGNDPQKTDWFSLRMVEINEYIAELQKHRLWFYMPVCPLCNRKRVIYKFGVCLKCYREKATK